MIDTSIEAIVKMVSNRNTSYKLFLMKYLVYNISEHKTVFSFKELSCGMVSESWKYYEHYYNRFTKNDRIFNLIQYSIDSNPEISIYSSKNQVFDFLWNNNDKQVVNMLKNLVVMVQYRLLVPFIESYELNGLTWNAQNKRIKELSRSYEMFYVINEKCIVVNPKWVRYISLNRKLILETLEGIISDEYGKKINNLRR